MVNCNRRLCACVWRMSCRVVISSNLARFRRRCRCPRRLIDTPPMATAHCCAFCNRNRKVRAFVDVIRSRRELIFALLLAIVGRQTAVYVCDVRYGFECGGGGGIIIVGIIVDFQQTKLTDDDDDDGSETTTTTATNIGFVVERYVAVSSAAAICDDRYRFSFVSKFSPLVGAASCCTLFR